MWDIKENKNLKNPLVLSVAYGPHAAFMALRMKANFHASPDTIMSLHAKHRQHQSKNPGFLPKKSSRGNNLNNDNNLECVHITCLSVQIISFTLVMDRSKVVYFSKLQKNLLFCLYNLIVLVQTTDGLKTGTTGNVDWIGCLITLHATSCKGYTGFVAYRYEIP